MNITMPRVQIRTARLTALILFILLMGALASRTQFAAAQSTGGAAACTQLLSLVEKNLQKRCDTLDKDQLCYGNDTISVKFKDPAAQSAFSKTGDIVPLAAIMSLTTSPLDPDTHKWGLAILKVHADLPGTTGNQAVTFVVYGDTTLTNKTTAGAAPAPVSVPACSGTTSRVTSLVADPTSSTVISRLAAGAALDVRGRSADGQWALIQNSGTVGWVSAQNASLSCNLQTMPVVNPALPAVMPGLSAFYFSTNVTSQSTCQDVPTGLLIKSQNGSKVSFKANGADLTIASSVVLKAVPGKTMQVKLIHGHATVDNGGVERTLTDGQELDVPLGGSDGLEADGPPSEPEQIPADDTSVSDSCAVAQSAGEDNACAVSDQTDQTQAENTPGEGETTTEPGNEPQATTAPQDEGSTPSENNSEPNATNAPSDSGQNSSDQNSGDSSSGGGQNDSGGSSGSSDGAQ